jgi:hypothetical protein
MREGSVNPKNVQALRVLLEEGIEATLGDAGHAYIGDCGRLAEWLVRKGGVTVPNALSDADARKLLYRALPRALSESETEREDGYWIRDGLCRIALGEPVS